MYTYIFHNRIFSETLFLARFTDARLSPKAENFIGNICNLVPTVTLVVQLRSVLHVVIFETGLTSTMNNQVRNISLIGDRHPSLKSNFFLCRQ
jgi:hypothetical protein